MAASGGHNLTYSLSNPMGNYVKQTSSQEPLDGLEPYLAEMFLTRSWSSFVTFCSDRSSKMAASAHKSLWLAKKDLLFIYYMEDGIVSCQESSLQDANQVFLLFWLIENPRWLPTAGHSLMYNPMGNMIKINAHELLKGLLKPYLAEMFLTRS